MHKRAIIAGDSIMTYDYENSLDKSLAKNLTSSLLPILVNCSVCNFSAAGQRMSSGGIAGFGLTAQKQALRYLMGSLKADILILTLGVNDWGAPEVGVQEFLADYKEFIRFAKEDLGMEVVVSLPLWNHEECIEKPHTDGQYTLVQWRFYIAQLGYLGGAHVFNSNLIGLLPEHFADGLHMNSQGHGIYTNALVDKLCEWNLVERY